MIAADELVSATPEKANKKPPWIFIAVFGVIVLCAAIFGAAGVIGAGKVALETAPIEAVLDSFMKSMAVKDVHSAYSLFSPRAKRQFKVSQLDVMTEENNFVLFEGYRNLKVENLYISATADLDPNLPQGIVGTVTGVITYVGGFQGNFEGTMEKSDGEWRIFYIYINVPLNKITHESEMTIN